MRIVAFGDTHTDHRNLQVPDGDVLLFAGDGEFRTPQDIIDFDRWLSDLPHEEIILIAGNHDFFCERYPNEVGNYLMEAGLACEVISSTVAQFIGLNTPSIALVSIDAQMASIIDAVPQDIINSRPYSYGF